MRGVIRDFKSSFAEGLGRESQANLIPCLISPDARHKQSEFSYINAIAKVTRVLPSSDLKKWRSWTRGLNNTLNPYRLQFQISRRATGHLVDHPGPASGLPGDAIRGFRGDAMRN